MPSRAGSTRSRALRSGCWALGAWREIDSVAGGEVDEVRRLLAAAHALDVLDDLGNCRARLGERRRMRRQGDAGMPPERIARRQRFRFEDIEVGLRQMAGIGLP